jgi:hypothetical protein
MGGVWFAFTLLIWPFMRRWWIDLGGGQLSDESILLASLALLGLVGGTVYGAILWVHDASLSGESLLQVIPRLHNNGRHILMVVIPAHWALALRYRESEATPLTLADPGRLNLLVVIGVGLLLIPSSYAAVVGTMAEEGEMALLVGDAMQDGDELLYVTPPFHSSHHLYRLKLGIDADGERGIEAHWRTTRLDWNAELLDCNTPEAAGSLSGVRWILLEPRVLEDPPEGWHIAEQRDSDWPGEDAGWRLYRWVGNAASPEPPCA